MVGSLLHQLSSRVQACIDHSGKALHALFDTVLLAIALLFSVLASGALLLMAALGSKPVTPQQPLDNLEAPIDNGPLWGWRR